MQFGDINHGLYGIHDDINRLLIARPFISIIERLHKLRHRHVCLIYFITTALISELQIFTGTLAA